ncbi:MAG: PilT/PilU family type 4a pilus ATPase [Clostridiales bacterium]|nr:PilT/PilU family type 4a pilus ATPase [Clostridiales bacterium]
MTLKLWLEIAKEQNATDLHICSGSPPLLRVNGTLAEIPGVARILPETVAEISEAILKPKQRARLDDELVLDFSFSVPGMGRYRANIYSQRSTYALAIRMLPFEIPVLHNLGLPASVYEFTKKTKGLFLITGATGSGKSTTLAALINEINEHNRYHIITIEDPIEYLHRHKQSLVTQREVGEDTSTFSQALRSALRQDPDVVMVGEMRDKETISIAMTAAETGHQVFSTLHTIGAAKSIDRIVDAFGIDQHQQVRFQLAAVLEGVISQQLLPRIDKKGLVTASEVMIVTPAIRNLIREGKHYQINNVLQTGKSAGMQILEADLARLIKENKVDRDEAFFRAQDTQLLTQYITRK